MGEYERLAKYLNKADEPQYNIVVNGHTIGPYSYEESKTEILQLFRAYRTVGATISIVSPVTGKIVDIYFLDKNFRMGSVAIN